jgi:DNA (cytosine-5)-methyltransferase 1
MTHFPSLPGASFHPANSAPGSELAGGGFSKLKVLDLFAGAGGMSLGLERTGGFTTVAQCEIEPFAQGILRKHWPEVPLYDDVTTADFAALGPVDLVTAGFPCQDISFAGKGAGLAGERSGLFWHVLRTAGLVGRPQLLLENVAALLDRGMGAVLGALASFGYDASWHCIPASAVGAPHRRDRIWIVADPQRDEQSRQEPCVGPFGRMGRIKQSLAWDGGWKAALSALRGMDDGLSRSVHRTDMMRNAVVPQVVTEIGHAILASRQSRISPRKGAASTEGAAGAAIAPPINSAWGRIGDPQDTATTA